MNIRKIYDTFTFFNEFDLLELRLHTLNEVVDRFVLVEGDRTFANASKPLYFSTMRDSRFDRFIDKISVVTVTEWPAFETAWHHETFQRNSIMRGLTNCRPDDLIIISDVDEIPSPEAILAYQPGDGIMALRQYLYWFAFNNISLAKPYWMKARVLDYASLLHGLDGHKVNNIYNPIDDDDITTPNKVRMYRVPPYKSIPSGGWHFTYLMSPEQISYKLKSFSHQELNRPEYTDPQLIKKRILAGRGVADPFGSRQTMAAIPLDHRFPAYLVNNQEKYRAFIWPPCSPVRYWFLKCKFAIILPLERLWKKWRRSFKKLFGRL